MTDLFARKRIPEFPSEGEFRTVIVDNRDPWPADAPKTPKPVLDLAKALNAGGWDTNIGYSRAYRRGQRTGTYRVAEFFGVYGFGHDSSPYRTTNIYWRYADKTEEFEWYRDEKTGEGALEQSEKACGTPAGWTWLDGRIIEGFNRHRVKVTDTKEFVKVRGSVLPGWFAGIARRFAEQAAAALCGSLEEHEKHTWETTTGILKMCSGKATKPKETQGV